MVTVSRFVALGALLTPGLAAACGGLFCDNAQPVNQAAERILFGHDGLKMQMHVRISYQGPPTEFGWLLPVPPDVETGLSSEAMFARLDQSFAPIFQLNFESENCGNDAGGGGAGGLGGGAGGEGGGGGGVQVLSREPVGPYDRSILQAESVDRLLEWLGENDYQVPPGSESTLQPYVDLGAAFVALKLLPGADAADIVPLRLTFTGDTPAVPIRPTAVAAEPDMGVIIHLLGPARAVSTNYLHVEINEAAIDWLSGASNYADVVSQAADEAGGRAFTTDYAGSTQGFQVGQLLPSDIAVVGEATTLGEVLNQLGFLDEDMQRILRAHVVPPEGLTVDEVLTFFFDYMDLPVDGGAIASDLTTEILDVRGPINALFARHPYLTRVFTTLSPAEMIDDPVFSFNADLAEQPRTRTATQVFNCDDRSTHLRLANGRRVALDEPIQREGGETVRGIEQLGAALIERQFAAGQSEVVEDRRGQIGSLGNEGGDDGCDCDASGGGPGPGALLGLVGLLALRRRR